MKPVRWTTHALEDLSAREISREEAETTLATPDRVAEGKSDRRIFQRLWRRLSGRHTICGRWLRRHEPGRWSLRRRICGRRRLRRHEPRRRRGGGRRVAGRRRCWRGIRRRRVLSVDRHCPGHHRKTEHRTKKASHHNILHPQTSRPCCFAARDSSRAGLRPCPLTCVVCVVCVVACTTDADGLG